MTNYFYKLIVRSSIIFLLFIFLLALLFSSCKNNRARAAKIESKIHTPKDDAEFEKEMSIVLKQDVFTFPADVSDSAKYMSWHELAREVYKQNEYHPIWVNKNVLSSKGKEMLFFLSTVEFLGLNKALYHYDALQKIGDSLQHLHPKVDYNLSKQLDVGLTRSFFQVALHVDRGMFGDTLRGINTNFKNYKKKYTDLFSELKTRSVENIISTLEPENPIYNRYMAALKLFVSKNNISSNPINIRDPKTDSSGAVQDARKALVYHHYLVDSLKNNDDAYSSALKKFQRDNNLNGDGAIGRNTIKALERDNSKKFQLLAINADRWRREHIVKLPSRYVWVNLPSYRVRIVEDDTVRLEKRIVIGKVTQKAATPILESAINQIVLWPSWNVPKDIVKNEMKSFKGFDVIDENGWMRVIQPPGLNNALGTVKILFPNKYSVYMHDTPSKSLFNSDLRAASHGCVRCQDALEIAANLMMMDTFQITYDSLKVLRDAEIRTKVFTLQHPVPVYFRYFTAEADFTGNLNFYADVYKRDKDMIDFIFNGRKPRITPGREKEYADSMALIRKKKKMDSLLIAAKPKEKI
ncbi:MAG: hypothetical protein JWN78_792 [Bacteroidota bacterium]|nr:hypothetical protein [Bacteroidota bacterium]